MELGTVKPWDRKQLIIYNVIMWYVMSSDGRGRPLGREQWIGFLDDLEPALGGISMHYVL